MEKKYLLLKSCILLIVWTWTLNFKKSLAVFGLGLSFENSGLDLDWKT